MDGAAVLELQDDLERYGTRLVRDQTTHDELHRAGFAVRGPVLDETAIAAVTELAEEFLSRHAEPWGEEFLTIGRVEDTALRREVIERAGRLVCPRLAPLFVDGAVVFGSALQVKPPSPRSALSPHQDSSLVDERTVPGVYAWVPLVDTDGRNGGLRVLPGSHRFANLHRTLNVPWQFDGHEEFLDGLSIQLEVPAGHVVLFDSATIHGSHPNRGDSTRLALNNFVRPAGAPLMHFYLDDDTEPGFVETFEVDETFYLGDDIMVRPGPPHRPAGLVPHHRVEADAERFEELFRRASAEAGYPRSDGATTPRPARRRRLRWRRSA